MTQRMGAHSKARGVLMAAALVLLVLPPPINVVKALAREHEHVGLRYQIEGSLRTAEEQYRRAIALDGDNGDAHNNLGTILVQMERPAEAEKAFAEASRCQPRNPVPLVNLARLLGADGRDAEAEQLLRRACELDPTDVKLLIDLGTSLARQGRFADAVPCYEAALELEPAVPELVRRSQPKLW